MTDIRVDLSNNSRLAYITVSLGLHRKILHNSSTLFGLIGSYAGDENLFPKNRTTDEYLKRVSLFLRASVVLPRISNESV